MKHENLLIALVGLLLIAPPASQAYYTTDQKALKLSENIGLFTVAYEFGLQDDLYMPIFTKRNLENGANTTQLGYEILDNSNTRTDAAETAGLVISNADLRDGMYFVPQGESAVFTLFTFAVMPTSEPEVDISLRVTELPYYVGAEKRPLGLNSTELEMYITPEIDLNENGRANGEVVETATGPKIKLLQKDN